MMHNQSARRGRENKVDLEGLEGRNNPSCLFDPRCHRRLNQLVISQTWTCAEFVFIKFLHFGMISDQLKHIEPALYMYCN